MNKIRNNFFAHRQHFNKKSFTNATYYKNKGVKINAFT